MYGDYPPEMHQYLGKDLPKFTLEETEYIKGSVDFIGINHYTTLYAMDCLHSPCNSSDFKAITGFSFTTAERDGAIIGEPVIHTYRPSYDFSLHLTVYLLLLYWIPADWNEDFLRCSKRHADYD